ncbi:MAG: Hsp20/alpha crystallin family protein [Gemmatimonadetes bacterium]|nr:Hsp20/alpha crystallin family protein [Gemmatimonadota bacterium]
MALTKTPTSPISRDITRMRNRIQRFLEEPFGFDLPFPSVEERRWERTMWSPAVEATETPSDYIVTAELPGIEPTEVDVEMANGMLTLKGKKAEERREEDKDRSWHLWERSYGSFERSFRFPNDVNESKVHAEFANGVLTVKVPKSEISHPAGRKIPVMKK